MAKLLTFNIDSSIDWDLVLKLIELWKLIPDQNGCTKSEKELSDKAALSTHTQRRMLKGEIRNPGFKNVATLLNTIGVQFTWVVNVPDESSQKFIDTVQEAFEGSDAKISIIHQEEASTRLQEKDKTDEQCPCQSAMMDLITHVKDLLIL